MKNKAFTLSEVLITLVVIGVVAAITVPILMQTHQNYIYSSALKKNFSVFSNAFALLEKFDYNDFRDWGHSDDNSEGIYENFNQIKNHLNIIRECNDKDGCWSQDITKQPNGQNAYAASARGIGDNIITFSLSDGTNVCLDYWNENDAKNRFGVTKNLLPSTLSVWVDVNGDKRPNTLGRDVYAFILTSNGLVPAGINNNSANCKTTGYDCAAKHLKKF